MDNECVSLDEDRKDVDVINIDKDDDSPKKRLATNTTAHHIFDDTSSYYEDKSKNRPDSSVFLQTLNLKSRDMSEPQHFSPPYISDSHPLAADGHLFQGDHQQGIRKSFMDSASTLEGYICNTNMATGEQETTPVEPYPNFLMDDTTKKSPVDEFKTDPDAYNEYDNQNSLGKTLATSLHLIAATDAHSLPSPVESHLPDSVGMEDALRSSNIESTGSNPIDPVTSTTAETESMPLTIRYRTRSFSINEKSAAPKNEFQPQDDDPEMKEERISSTGDDNYYRCDQCGKVFYKKQTLRQHFITHTDRFACTFCDVRCKSKGDLRSHTQTHTKEKPFHCEVCNTYYTRESILKKHKTTQLHNNAYIKYKRMKRQRKRLSFADAFDSDTQDSIKMKKTSMLGGCCPKKEQQRHSKPHNIFYVCSKCHKKCKSADLLKIHERCHSKSTLLTCRICSYSFSSSAVLKDHVKGHYRERSRILKPATNKEVVILPAPETNNANAQQQNKEPIQEKEKKNKKQKEKEILYCQTCPRRFKSPKAFEKHCAKHNLKLPQLTSKEGESKLSETCVKDVASTKEDCVNDGNVENAHYCADCPHMFSTLESLKTHRSEIHNMQTMACHICYKIFEDSSEFKNHVQNHAPTMLFSGQSLEDTRVNIATKRATKRCVSNKIETFDSNATQELRFAASKNTVSNDAKIPDDDNNFDTENSLHCYEFIKLMKTVIEESSDDGASDDDEEKGETDDEQLFRGLQNLLNHDPTDHGDFLQACVYKDPSNLEYQSFLNSHSTQDFENNLYKCIPCSACFMEKVQLTDHMKTHICDICFEFFVDKKALLEHKSLHEPNQNKEQSNKSFEFLQMDDASSTSEDEANDLFLDELESILDCETKNAPQIDLLHTFNHEEIVKANKKTFERYSCIDIPTNIYACTICKRKYARPTTLTRHFKTHVCHYCNKFFIDKADLLEHKYKHRQKAALLKAEISGEQTTKLLNSPVVSKTNRELFKKFTFIDSSRNLNRCCLCDKTFVRKTVLTRHMKTHICSYCDKFYEDKYELARHVGMHKIDARVSEDSGETREFNDFDDEKPYATRSTLTDHLDTDGKVVALGPSFPPSLPHYSSAYANPGGGAHETLTFIEIPVSDNCENTTDVAFGGTNETVTSTYQIISDSIEAFKESAHESFIVDGSGCQPDDSNKIITIAQSQIMADDGNQERLNLFECTLCGKTFFKSGHLKSHMSTHTVNKPHVCHLCGKSFVRRGALKRHEKAHDIKRCKFCDTNFNFQFELDDHMQMHESYPFYK